MKQKANCLCKERDGDGLPEEINDWREVQPQPENSSPLSNKAKVWETETRKQQKQTQKTLNKLEKKDI